MNLVRLIWATVAAGVVNLALQSVLFGIIPGVKESAGMLYRDLRDRPLMHFHLLGHLTMAFLLAATYPWVYQGGAKWWEGMRFGAVAGVLVSLPCAFHQYGMLNASFGKLMIPVAWTVFVLSIVGIAVAYSHGDLRVSTPIVSGALKAGAA